MLSDVETDFYRPPQADEPAPASVSPKPLYKTAQIGLASFLGTPVAGCLLIYLNERRLGRARASVAAVVLAGASLLAMFAIAIWVPDKTARMLGIAGVLAPCVYAELTQGVPVRLGLVAGRARASTWRAAGIGVLTGAAVFGALFGVMLLNNATRARVDFGHEQHVFYEGGASEAQARQLGKLLRERQIFTDQHAVDVTLTRTKHGYRVSFVLESGWNDADVTTYYDDLRATISAEIVGSEPVTIVLLDEYEQERNTLGPAP